MKNPKKLNYFYFHPKLYPLNFLIHHIIETFYLILLFFFDRIEFVLLSILFVMSITDRSIDDSFYPNSWFSTSEIFLLSVIIEAIYES